MQADPPCPTCDATGVTFADRADHRGEHYTAELPCPDCTDCDGPDVDEDSWRPSDREVSL